jgi:hypothetical protein
MYIVYTQNKIHIFLWIVGGIKKHCEYGCLNDNGSLKLVAFGLVKNIDVIHM